jgi:hypothetical protein
VTDTVVISGAAAVSVGTAAPTPLLSVPELLEVAIADPGSGLELVIHNPTGAPLRIAVEDVGDITIAPAARTVVPLLAEPGGARLHLQALSTPRSQAVMVIVAVEPSDDGPITVGQAIGARTC